MVVQRDEFTNGVGHMESDKKARFTGRTDLNSTNQGVDFRIPTGTRQMHETDDGPCNLNVMVRSVVGSGIMCDPRDVPNGTVTVKTYNGDAVVASTDYTRPREQVVAGKAITEPGIEERVENNTVGVRQSVGSYNRPIA